VLVALLAFAGVWAPLVAAAETPSATYEALPITATVVDAESGEPVADAVVVGTRAG
jgi:hypothetical protein